MKDIEELLPRVHEVAPACPEPTAIRHLRDAAIDFCRRTRVWRDYDEFPLGASACEAIAASSEAQIFEITHASVRVAEPDEDEDESNEDCRQIVDLEAKTVDWLDKEYPGWRDKEGTPLYLTQIEPNTVRVVPKPEVGSTLRLELILLPSVSAERLPDVLVVTYGQVIADGALGRLLLLPTDFSRPDLAAVHAKAFADALGRWGAQIPRGQQRAKRRTKTASFF